MALSNSTDPAQAAVALAEWLGRRMPEADNVQVTDVDIPKASGLSNETVLFSASWTVDGERRDERLVARVAPSGPAVFPTYDLGLEFKVMEAFGPTNVPVPEVLFHEDDPSVLGGEFLVMKFITGQIAPDDPPFTAGGWVLDLGAERQAELADNALKTLVDLHAVDWRGLGLDEIINASDQTACGLDEYIDHWQGVYEWAAEGEVNPTIEGAFDWIRANRPDRDEDLVANWGDARLGNLLIADDLSIAGVLDWEMVGIAEREMDLAWWIFMLRHHTEGVGAPMPEGFPSFEEIVARYEELSGHTVRDIDFYEVLAALRLSILMHRAGHVMVAAGLAPPDSAMRFNNPASQLLAKLAGLPAPSGDVQSFIGNR